MRPILDIRRAKVLVELTSRCNLRCAMCPMTTSQRPPSDMPWWLVEKIAADFAANQVQVSWLFELGEPLLYRRLEEAIEKFPGSAVSTNALLLDDNRARALLATSLERIRLCIDTVDPEIYPLLRRGGDFATAAANIRGFLGLSDGHPIRVEIQRMITRQTSHETVADMERFFDLDRHPQAMVVEKTCEGLDTAAATELHDAYYGCFQGHPFGYLVVLADGRVTHCCYDSDGRQAIGDLKTETLQEILASPRLAAVASAFTARDWENLPRCGECYGDPSGKAVVLDQLTQLGHRLDRLLPIKKVARKIINR